MNKSNQSIIAWRATIELFFGGEAGAKAWIAKAKKAGAQLDETKKKEKKQ